MKKIKIGIIGFGTVGSAVIKVLQSRRGLLEERGGVNVELALICDKDLKTKRPVKVAKNILTKSIGKILYDPDIDIVVELVGGVHPAKDIILEALREGKHVVTANKAVLSEAAPEIFGLAGKLGLAVAFEASVGGGIPIIRSLKEGFIADKIELMYGIINGTSNFILSRMARDGYSFKMALGLAEKCGYAERNPDFDIGGIDASHKLSILALLGFGIHVVPKNIYTEGIASIEPMDIQFAQEQGYAIKPLAIAKNVKGAIELRVHPTLIPNSHQLANVGGVYNAIYVKGDLIGENLFYGEGAGASPTSSAVVSDIMSVARLIQDGSRIELGISIRKNSKILKPMEEVRAKHYIRFSTIDKPGVLAKISGVLAKFGISIVSVTQKERRPAGAVPIVMMTHEAAERNMALAIKEIDRLNVIKKRSVRIRVEA